jgi:serine protease inhibitor
MEKFSLEINLSFPYCIGMVIMTRCMPIVIPFNANKPFFIQIVDRKTNFVLFSASCMNPAVPAQ